MQMAYQWRHRIIGGRGAAKMGGHRSGDRGPSLLTDLLTTTLDRPGACRSLRSSWSLRCLTCRFSGQWMHRARRCTSLRRWPRWWSGMCCAGPIP